MKILESAEAESSATELSWLVMTTNAASPFSADDGLGGSRRQQARKSTQIVGEARLIVHSSPLLSKAISSILTMEPSRISKMST